MRTTLLLNASYEPLCVIPVKRAVVLVMADKADIISEGNDPFRSARVTMSVPSVIRLRYYVKVPYRTSLPLNRRALVTRDQGRCAYCAGKGTTIDHVHPRSRGGEHIWENVVLACQPCNARKDDRLLTELGWKLKFRPKAPAAWSYFVVGIGEIDPQWEQWIVPKGSALAPV